MTLGNSPRALVALLALAPFVLLGACQTTMAPVVPAGSSAYEAIAVPPEQADPVRYALRAGDVVSISVYGEPELAQERVLIDQGGNLFLPLVGQVRAAGLSPAEFSAELERAYGSEFLRDPDIAVTLNQSRAQTVSVEGEVSQPGVYQIEPGQTLLSAMALARSPTKTAKLDEVLVFREVSGQRMGARFDLVRIRAGVDPDPRLLPGDVVVVGFSKVQGAYRDILQAAPLLNVFAQF